MKNKVIYFDFDRTLLDTDALKIEQERRIAAITNISAPEIRQAMAEFIQVISDHLVFTPEGFAHFLEEKFGISPSDVLKIYITDSNYIASYLYNETLNVLRILKENGNSLGIFSAAMPGPQRLKIERTGILEFIEEELIIIDPKKLGIEVLELLPDEVIIVDDDIQVINKLSSHMPRFQPIWCNRKSKEILPKVRTIHNLLELLE